MQVDGSTKRMAPFTSPWRWKQ